MNIRLRIANYITRYAPSRCKISAYLAKKKCETIPEILSEIGYDEELMIDIWMRSLLATGKWRREITMKLSKKEFPKELIEAKVILAEEDIMDWESNRSWIESQVTALLQRGKSLRIIAMTLSGKYPYFRDKIREYVASLDDSDSLTQEVERYQQKYNISDPKEKQKFYAALMRKGFGYQEIKAKISTSH
jgi:SOS response regulatory protein OraA/RecX